MTTNAFLLDLGKCIACQACVAACKTGNELNVGAQFIHIDEVASGSYPNVRSSVKNHRCYHCADAACVAVCPTGALFREGGLTRTNPDICSACGYCLPACPFKVPQLVNNKISKCDGCADVTAAGGTPWCVKTCPSQALEYGPREEILAEAKKRAAVLQKRYPNARVYGETEAGGLGVVMVLPDAPETMELPAEPKVSGVTTSWQKVVQPVSIGFTGLSVLVTGIAAIIARRAHAQEMAAIEAELAAQETQEEVQDGS